MHVWRSLAALAALAAGPWPVLGYPWYGSGSDAMPRVHSARGRPAEGKKGVFMMNRIAPATSKLYVANADGTNETKLMGGNDADYDYHATFSPDGEWISFTSERGGDGNSDVYRVRADGSDLEKILATSAMEDNLVISPDGKSAAYVSTANGYIANIWVMDLDTKETHNITNTPTTRTEVSNDDSPRGHFRPSWSPDGEWLAFSSDRETQWTGHSNGTGWESTQELSVYVIRPDGTDFRKVVSKDGYSLGAPRWSPDGKRIVFYEMTREDTYQAHSFGVDKIKSSIVSVDVATGKEREVHVSGKGGKVNPTYIGDSSVIGYVIKGEAEPGVNYTSHSASHSFVNASSWDAYLRSPAWSPDGTKMVYEKQLWKPVRAEEKVLYSWDDDWEYRFTDVFPVISRDGSRFALTEKQLGNSSVVSYNMDGSDKKLVFNSADLMDVEDLHSGTCGAYQPDWSPNGEWIAFGLGFYFGGRAEKPGRLIRATSNGSHWEYLTDGSYNAGFPSYSADGKKLVFRAWDFDTGDTLGLKLLDVSDKSITNLTSEWDVMPHFSRDGSRILATRRTTCCTVFRNNYDVVTMDPDGGDVKVLTRSSANEAHAVYSWDGKRILYSSGEYGFREECGLYDETFQPYGQMMSMDLDGGDKKMLVDSMWEDSMPMYIPNELLEDGWPEVE